MKARLPQGYGGGGAANLQQIARQAQKLQEEMDAVSTELETTEYSATAGGDAVKAIATEQGYAVVTDRASATSIIFASPDIDISNEVLARLGYSN